MKWNGEKHYLLGGVTIILTLHLTLHLIKSNLSINIDWEGRDATNIVVASFSWIICLRP
jgi:hypothetical protein